jgi:hypothetical protein
VAACLQLAPEFRAPVLAIGKQAQGLALNLGVQGQTPTFSG